LLFGHFMFAICIASLGAILTCTIAAHYGKEPLSVHGPK
jgi:hypothetical protein